MATLDTLQDSVNSLTSSTTTLVTEVQTKKATLDASVADSVAARDASQSARDTALGYKSSAEAAATSATNTAASLVGFDLAAISDTIAVTAVDVFVYDTSKDSDGGAWRKRTQGTSWYNETLGTATRGNRKEFPAVAVIVADNSDTVTIYDGDDPSMPMWMVFNTGGGSFSNHRLLGPSGTISGVKVVNGILAVCKSGGGHSLVLLDFIKESSEVLRLSNNEGLKGFHSTRAFSERNVLSGEHNGTLRQLISNIANDVAMTVLPNAPIDPATGLPVPTIAVATSSGVSVIKDDGIVVDINTVDAKRVTFYDENKRLILRDSGSACSYGLLPTVDQSNTSWREGFFNETSSFPSTLNQTDQKLYSNRKLELGVPSNKGVSLIDVNGADQATSTGAYITSTYNTGWMNGNIKGAFLSDTDATSVVGSGELVTNGDFASNVSGWTVTANGTLTYSSGSAILEQVTGSNASFYQSITTVVGKRYVASCDVTGITSRILIGTSASSGNVGASGFLSNTTIAIDFVATSTTTFFSLQGGGSASGQQTTVDNISVRLADADRSVNNKGLRVFGTVTKTAVATGADLVAYSGFSASNYLEQPYNSGLNFGTGDFSVMGWYNLSNIGSSAGLFSKGVSTRELTVFWSSANNLRLYIDNVQVLNPTFTGVVGSWVFVTATRTGGVAYIYANGELLASAANSASTDTANDTFLVGKDHAGQAALASIALVRVSSTAPTAAQIAKIYNDEKFLFQAGAQATLYGASDAVTALGYDDATDLLHVGTSQGRSVFQGLRRVSNTAIAVGTAISASNGLVVEE